VRPARSRAADSAEAGLARLAGLTREEVPASAQAAFDRLAFDFVSVVVAGLGDAGCVRAADAFGGLSDFGADPSATAFALGACAHWFDWDDTDDVSHVHGGAVVFPALFAMHAAQSSAGRRTAQDDFVAAAVGGYEIACRLGDHLKNHGHRGWMPTGSAGAVGAAAAAARLQGCDRRGILSAMGIAAASAGIGRQALVDRTNAKGVLAGVAARTAMDAVALATRGVEGARHFVDGAYGLCALQADGTPMEAAALPDSGLLIERVSVKPYPCCRSAHAVIDGVLDFRRESPAAAARVAGIEVSAPPGVFERCGARFSIGANARLSAQFSIPYTAAVALRKGRVELVDFEERQIAANGSEWKGLIEAIHVRRDPQCTSDVLAPVRMRLLAGGETVAERDVTALRGDPRRPLSPAEQGEKLRNAARSVLREGEIGELEGLVRNLRHDGPHDLVRWFRARLAARARAAGA
jgi:2-methylcitrate dehydratase PrpD